MSPGFFKFSGQRLVPIVGRTLGDNLVAAIFPLHFSMTFQFRFS